ncbi:phage tail protein [Peptoniphilus sp. EMRHCC_23]|uniref:phage tail spike protein n=1 Tax=Peptoniphilus rachelemmaiella TaxID=2811779 RepID=UPI001C004EE0|nr:phage tail spike protein [Peptoniphilus rachelemmaiella]
MMLLEVQDANRKKIAYLENAFGITEELKINSINFVNFSMPKNDLKNEHLKMFNYVKTPHGLYRILKVTEDENSYEYEAEHVIATLLDHVIFGTVVYGNLGIYTKNVIQYVLNKQKVKNWVLDECDFSRQFEYCWENENLAGALFSIPKPLEAEYIWKFNTDQYPWKLSLKKLTKDEAKLHIRPKKNQISLKATSNPRDICTRIYPLGYGEGVNQLTIKSINNGIPYLQAEQKYIDKYGLQERVWVDRRYEKVDSLKDAAQVMLDRLKEPIMEFEVDFALFKDDDFTLGDTVVVSDKYRDTIIGIQYNYSDIMTSKVTIANDSTSIAGTVADLADRQRIEMTYAQGATQLYAQSIQVNADDRYGAELNFYVPQEMRVINKVIAKVKIDSFRAYSKAIKGGGGSTDSTESGGGYYNGSSTEGGGYQTATSDIDQLIYGTIGGHNHGIPSGWIQLYNRDGNPWYREKFLQSGNHTHFITLKNHTHDFRINIPSHTHRFEVRDHTHDIEFGIFRSHGNVRYFTVKVNGKVKDTIYDTSGEIDLTTYLLNNKNVISRGSWHSIEIVPSDLAYVTIDLFFQGFVQSRGDYTV